MSSVLKIFKISLKLVNIEQYIKLLLFYDVNLTAIFLHIPEFCRKDITKNISFVHIFEGPLAFPRISKTVDLRNI